MDGVAAALADQYPLVEVGQEVAVTVTAQGATQTTNPGKVRRLSSSDRAWQVTLAETFLSVDTTQYVSRDDFAGRLEAAWSALTSRVPIPFVARLGVRYVNQVTNPEQVNRLPGMLHPAIVGVTAGQSPEGVSLTSVLTEARYTLPDGGEFLARWGLLQAGARIDTAQPSYEHPTWVLDMDSARQWAPGAQKGESLPQEARVLAVRGYQFFRWAVTDEFLGTFGGQPGTEEAS